MIKKQGIETVLKLFFNISRFNACKISNSSNEKYC